MAHILSLASAGKLNMRRSLSRIEDIGMKCSTGSPAGISDASRWLNRALVLIS